MSPLTGSTLSVANHQVDGDILQRFQVTVNAGTPAGSPIRVQNLVGVAWKAANADDVLVIDSTRKRWKFDVHNETGYNASTGVADAWAAVTQGAYVYIDTNYRLTLSPLDSSGNANAIFGTVTDNSLSGTATQYTELMVEIMVADD